MSDNITYGEWQIWNGGECPVDPETKVQVHFLFETRGEAMKRAPERAGDWQWDSGCDLSIIAYRVVKEPETFTVDYWVAVYGKGAVAFAENGDYPEFVEITMTVETVDGMPVRGEWEAKQ